MVRPAAAVTSAVLFFVHASAIITLPPGANTGQNLLPNIDDPNAVNAQTACPGYTATNVQTSNHGMTATLSLAGDACNAYGTDVDSIDLTVEYQANDRLNIELVPSHIDSTNSSWYILPETLVPKPQSEQANADDSDLTFTWSNKPSFNFKVTRKSTGDVLFNTEGTVIVFENQFIELVSSLPEDYNLYGLGERMHGLRLGNNFTATTYTADNPDPLDVNIYGFHPFYLDTRYYEVDGDGSYTYVPADTADPSKNYVSQSHGVFLRNAHGQEVLLRPDNITWRTIGGSLDLYFYAGPSQAEVTSNYQASTIGLPAMQQYWTFGYHQSNWDWPNWDALEQVVANFSMYAIPLETMWSDIDYMDQYRNFQNDPVNYPYDQGADFIDSLHQNGMQYVPIVDPIIYYPNPNGDTADYAPYDRGTEANVWLTNPDGSVYIGAGWPGYTVYPDWRHPNTSAWWLNELALWGQSIKFDGIWIDMNEVSSSCVGSCGSAYVTQGAEHEARGFDAAADATTPTPGVRDINYPPYVINHVQPGHDLAVGAVSPNATHVDGVQEYDVHNLYGYQETNGTYQALTQIIPGKRPFILSRSTFAGSGKWAAHWGGDNLSDWLHMFLSIPQALSFSLYGIPMFGVDTCGFENNTDEELCNRWMMLSAFFPFYRNHNCIGSIPQEPYQWTTVTQASKFIMGIRYALLPYMYTLFHDAHTTGSTVMRALAWEFPNDPSLAAADRQFLLGPSLMIIPVLDQGATSVDGVFPGIAQGEIWYDYYTQTEMAVQAGVNTTLDTPLGHIQLFIRGGSVLPMQQPALVTRDVRNSPWSLLVALSGNGTASGSLYVDDGESIVQNATLSIDFKANTTDTETGSASSSSSLYASVSGDFQDTNGLGNVTILGVSSVGNVTFNGNAVGSDSIAYNQDSKVLIVNGLLDLTQSGAWDQDWVLSW